MQPPFAGDRDAILPAAEDLAPPAATASPAVAKAAPLVGSRFCPVPLMLALYVAFVRGAVYDTPKFLSHALNMPYPMAEDHPPTSGSLSRKGTWSS